MAQNRAMARERDMPAAERERAQRARQAEELAAMGTRAMKASRERAERNERREREAVASQRFDISVVAKAALGHLMGQGLVDLEAAEDGSDEKGARVRDEAQIALERLLVGIYNAILNSNAPESQWALDVCQMLDRWREWSERGGMNRDDLRAVLEKKTAFCWAAVAVGLVSRVCEKEKEDGGGILGDVRECLRVWKMVRLG
ncbi:MAG: hypothetical protein Q9218_007148 [Villophora microphyllina]